MTDADTAMLADALNGAIRDGILNHDDHLQLTHHDENCPNSQVDDLDDVIPCDCKSFVIPVSEAISVGSDRLASKMVIAFGDGKERA